MFIAASGRAQSLLHLGPKITPQIQASLEFEVDNGTDEYSMRLFHAAGDTLVFAQRATELSSEGLARATQEP